MIGSGFLCLEVMSIQFHAKRMLEAGPSGGADYFIRFLTLKLTAPPLPPDPRLPAVQGFIKGDRGSGKEASKGAQGLTVGPYRSTYSRILQFCS